MILNINFRDCKGDGFSVLYYNHTNHAGKVSKRFFKYKYVEDIENDKFYNFHQVIAFLDQME